MKSKIEERLDREFAKFDMRPRVFHYKDVVPFNTITVVTNIGWKWNDIAVFIRECSKSAFKHKHNHATYMLQELEKQDIVGIAICDHRDQFNRKLGRIIAKGRLLKHLKNKGEEK